MELKDFDYNLPKNLIAKTPLKKRGQSRLLIMDKDNGGFIHKQFDLLTLDKELVLLFYKY